MLSNLLQHQRILLEMDTMIGVLHNKQLCVGDVGCEILGMLQWAYPVLVPDDDQCFCGDPVQIRTVVEVLLLLGIQLI